VRVVDAQQQRLVAGHRPGGVEQGDRPGEGVPLRLVPVPGGAHAVTREELDHDEADSFGRGEPQECAATHSGVTMEQAGPTVAGRGAGEKGRDLVLVAAPPAEHDFLHRRCINHGEQCYADVTRWEEAA
jgi:hypothetical protein